MLTWINQNRKEITKNLFSEQSKEKNRKTTLFSSTKKNRKSKKTNEWKKKEETLFNGVGKEFF